MCNKIVTITIVVPESKAEMVGDWAVEEFVRVTGSAPICVEPEDICYMITDEKE